MGCFLDFQAIDLRRHYENPAQPDEKHFIETTIHAKRIERRAEEKKIGCLMARLQTLIQQRKAVLRLRRRVMQAERPQPGAGRKAEDVAREVGVSKHTI